MSKACVSARQVVFSSKKRGELFLALVDAESGEMHVRRCLTSTLAMRHIMFTPATVRRVFPRTSTPLTTQPPVVSRTLVTTRRSDVTASPNGWIAMG
jgi:hypothetical protein